MQRHRTFDAKNFFISDSSCAAHCVNRDQKRRGSIPVKALKETP
jgi:hypothetical protein